MKRRKLLYLVSKLWYPVLHRLPMAAAARDAGYEAPMVTKADCAQRFLSEGSVLQPAN